MLGQEHVHRTRRQQMRTQPRRIQQLPIQTRNPLHPPIIPRANPKREPLQQITRHAPSGLLNLVPESGVHVIDTRVGLGLPAGALRLVSPMPFPILYSLTLAARCLSVWRKTSLVHAAVSLLL